MYSSIANVKALTLTQQFGSKQPIMKNFELFVKRLRRFNVNIYSYFWTKEFTKKGERHLHVIFEHEGYISQKWLSEIWKDITKGESFIVWINDKQILNAAGYAMKYLTKAYSTEYRYKKHEHRYGFSRNAPPFKPDNFKTIEYDSFTLEYHAGDYQRVGKNEKPRQK